MYNVIRKKRRTDGRIGCHCVMKEVLHFPWNAHADCRVLLWAETAVGGWAATEGPAGRAAATRRPLMVGPTRIRPATNLNDTLNAATGSAAAGRVAHGKQHQNLKGSGLIDGLP